MRKKTILIVWAAILLSISINTAAADKTRVIVTSDGEIDDQCSLVRFLLYSNDFDVEGIIKSSSQYHAQDHNWAGDYWEVPILEAYAQVYPNLVANDPDYPTPEYLQSITKLGNVKTEGEMSEVTPGSQFIVDILLDESDNNPIWLQAWGGTNTIARALKTIEETHPEKMAYVASKIRFYFIWEQDETFQSYIRSHWATPYNIQTIISDQFITFGYWWTDWNLPQEKANYFSSSWMKENLLYDRGPLLTFYNSKSTDKFNGEGDSPSFIHEIPTGLRNLESPDWGGWGGRYIHIRENTWLDPVPESNYTYPEGRWYTSNAWGRSSLRDNSATDEELLEYFNPIVRWIDVIQNDFAARADWCVKSYSEANHQPVVSLAHPLDITAQPGSNIQLSAQGSYDPDGDQLSYTWWQYTEAGSYNGTISIQNSGSKNASFTVPFDAAVGQTIHVICQVTDNGTPSLTRYQRVVVTVGACTSAPVTGVNVSPATKNIGVGEVVQLTATIEPECAGNKNISWSSGNSSIASVSSSGLVTGLAEGSTTIKATTVDGGFTATCNVSVTGTSTPTTLTIQENETGFCSVDGSIDNNNSGFTGAGFANTDNASGEGITWSVNIPAAGTYSIVWRFANGGSSDRTGKLMVDGSTVVSNVSMPSTGGWKNWTETSEISVNLSAGTKLIRLQATNSSGLANVDYITLSGGSLSAVACNGLKSVQTPASLTDNDLELKMNCYPNPVGDQLNIQFSRELTEAVDVYLYDITGKMVKSSKAIGLNHSLDMSDLPNGLFKVRISGENLNVLGLVVKK